MARFIALVFVVAIAAAALWRANPNGDWQPILPSGFAEDSCDTYELLVGEGHDLRSDPAAAALVARCAEGHARSPWATTIMGVGARFEQPAVARLRVEVIDMQRNSSYPSMQLRFVYPPVGVDRKALETHWRPWRSWRHDKPDAETVALWTSPHAGLFGPWALGRAPGEAWLGQEAIRKPEFCAATPADRETGETMCRLDVQDARGKPISVELPLARPLEWRLEMIELCRFGGVKRQHAGEMEYSDQGCTPFPTP